MTNADEKTGVVALCVSQAALMAGAAALAVAGSVLEEMQRRKPRKRIHPGIRAAREHCISILDGPNDQFCDLFRMEKAAFIRLVKWLRQNTGLDDSRVMPVEMKVMISLFILAHGVRQRVACHTFHVSQATVSKVMSEMIGKLAMLQSGFVRQPPTDYLDSDIELGSQTDAFNGCIGAVDCTQVPAFVLLGERDNWRIGDNECSQNVCVAVNFSGEYVCVFAGSEGPTPDKSVLRGALGASFAIPEGRYYLGDSAFEDQAGVVAPFPDTQYEWPVPGETPKTKQELYNLHHAKGRKIVEDVIARTKRQFGILRKGAPEYKLEDQKCIVYATTALYNLILLERRETEAFQSKAAEGERDGEAEAEAEKEKEEELLRLAKLRAEDIVKPRSSNEIRELAADLLWTDYQQRRGQKD